MEFLTGKKLIDKTKLFGIVSKVGDAQRRSSARALRCDRGREGLLELAYKHADRIHVRIPHILNASNIVDTVPDCMPLPDEHESTTYSVTHADYTPDSWVSLANARKTFDSALGGPEGFDKWLRDSLMINPSEAYGTHNTLHKIWRKFLTTFQVARGLIFYRPLWIEYIRKFFVTFIDDGASYLEPRIPFYHKMMHDADGHLTVPHREWMLDFECVMNEVKEELKAQGREDDFVGARVIYTSLRNVSPEDLQWYMDDCIALKQEFPHLIAAFNKRVKSLGLDLPLILHAGETCSDGGKADVNLYDAILLGTKRIGHGYSIVKHPKLMQICRENGILLEVCPISNEVLRLTSSMPTHHLPIMLSQGVPIALCPDDPSVFGSMGLSYDFFQVLVASELTGIITLAEIARDSLTYSTLEPAEKDRALAIWGKRWAKFVDEIVALDRTGDGLQN
ncbi:hypothetical protein EWM64_g1023 [Hericium alpestre]|uniref:Adenosine deaminase domain-containing protein n=1 Tax=Hericium alpestre TaxID=135208 RepID=A0A4Z0AAJ5_9AGAM|nr:hypothetical protein EWM64_g1023 [Hericium alpestre]